MMNEETKASLNKFLKEREERIKNMTLAEARDIVSRIYGHSDMRMESDKALQMLLDCADKALEQTRWIPVSERLPKDNQTEYLVTYKAKGREWINIGFCDEGFWYIYSNDSSPTMEVNVTAWMPLPQPYKAESEDKE